MKLTLPHTLNALVVALCCMACNITTQAYASSSSVTINGIALADCDMYTTDTGYDYQITAGDMANNPASTITFHCNDQYTINVSSQNSGQMAGPSPLTTPTVPYTAMFDINGSSGVSGASYSNASLESSPGASLSSPVLITDNTIGGVTGAGHSPTNPVVVPLSINVPAPVGAVSGGTYGDVVDFTLADSNP